MRLENKIAIVTGVGGANGRAIALGYAREGADLAVVDEDQAKADAVAKEVQALGRRALALQVDVTKKAQVVEMADKVVAEFGRIDILFNGTGVAHNQQFLTFSEADFDHALDVGLKAFFLTSQAVGKKMAENTSGKIINLTSIVARLGSGEAVAWCTTRSGVDAMTRALGQALGYYGVNCNALAHGGVEGGANYEPADMAERRRRIPLGRLGYPEDLVGPAIFLASDDANFLVGETIFVDGGYTTAAVTEDQFRPEWARAEHTANGPRTDRYARTR
jgi:NAD(P)-dependent dehydrogenase (short-subunit alcohol dehydrogenase family)